MVIVTIHEGLGNQMFQYALGRCLSVKLDTELVLYVKKPKPKTYQNSINRREINHRYYNLDLFNIEAKVCSIPTLAAIQLTRILSYSRVINMSPLHYIRENHFHFDQNLLKSIPKGKSILIDGYWQSPLYFSSIESIIRKDFTFKDTFLNCSQGIKKAIEQNISICVHVRRGDYLHSGVDGTGGAKAIHNTISESSSYFENAMMIMSQKVGNPLHFFLFSDDIDWCKENIHTHHPITFVDDSHAGNGGSNHFRLMKCCDHFIISNSTFSWWAAWLSESKNKIVIAPKKWFNKPGKDTSILIPFEWIKL